MVEITEAIDNIINIIEKDQLKTFSAKQTIITSLDYNSNEYQKLIQFNNELHSDFRVILIALDSIKNKTFKNQQCINEYERVIGNLNFKQQEHQRHYSNLKYSFNESKNECLRLKELNFALEKGTHSLRQRLNESTVTKGFQICTCSTLSDYEFSMKKQLSYASELNYNYDRDIQNEILKKYDWNSQSKEPFYQKRLNQSFDIQQRTYEYSNNSMMNKTMDYGYLKKHEDQYRTNSLINQNEPIAEKIKYDEINKTNNDELKERINSSDQLQLKDCHFVDNVDNKNINSVIIPNNEISENNNHDSIENNHSENRVHQVNNEKNNDKETLEDKNKINVMEEKDTINNDNNLLKQHIRIEDNNSNNYCNQLKASEQKQIIEDNSNISSNKNDLNYNTMQNAKITFSSKDPYSFSNSPNNKLKSQETTVKNMQSNKFSSSSIINNSKAHGVPQSNELTNSFESNKKDNQRKDNDVNNIPKQKYERIHNIVLKAFKNDTTIKELKRQLGNNFEDKLIQGNIDEEYISNVERILANMDNNTKTKIEYKSVQKSDKINADIENDPNWKRYQLQMQHREKTYPYREFPRGWSSTKDYFVNNNPTIHPMSESTTKITNFVLP